MPERRLVELGFEGGAVLRVTIDEDRLAGLRSAVFGDDGDWVDVQTEEGDHWINADELLWVRVVPREPSRVGFGQG